MIYKKDKNLFRFLDWQVYKDAQGSFIKILKLIRNLPTDLRFTLGAQIIRSSLSVVLNIAEGSGRHTEKEMSRFFDISIGSINETVAGVDCLFRLNYVNKNSFQKFFLEYESISRQLGGFKKKLS